MASSASGNHLQAAICDADGISGATVCAMFLFRSMM
jgi:hypothetical protein